MTEVDFVSQIQTARANIALVLSLVFTMLSVMVVATHYFLGKEGLVVRMGVFVIFTGGYVALLSLYLWEITHLRAALIELERLSDQTVLSEVSSALLNWSGGPGSIQAWLPQVMYFLGWFLVGTYLFYFNHQRRSD
ncbi:MAG: hypothetical protein AAFV37_13200 [Pseudomonadota bacterium]